MIRRTKTSTFGTLPSGDAFGRLVVTLTLTTGMSAIALVAGLHTAFGLNLTPEAATDRPAETYRVATANRRDGVDLVGILLPLPLGPDDDAPEIRAPRAGFAFVAAVPHLAALPVPTAGPPRAGAALAQTRDAGTVEPATASLPEVQSTVEWLAVPTAPAPESGPILDSEHVVVQRGDTLLQILMRSGIDRAEAHEVVGTLSTVYDPRRLRVGQAMAVEVERAGDALAAPRLTTLSLNLDFNNDLRVERDANGEFAARKVDRELTQTVHAAQAVIETSLYHTARRHSVPDQALVHLANIFSWDVDFQRDVHPGDSFEIVYEQVEGPDGEIRSGEVLFASLRLRGRNVHAYRYEHADGTSGYYDFDGISLRKWLMRTPIDGARLSSGFGPRRHPILGYNRMHRGVDFAAPTGTPIYAAGDGLLTYVGRNGAYGNYIRIRHNDEFSSAYAHMSRFADGIKKGARVRQGQVIAFVGSTGRSTGPHLHYEVLQNGTQINPMSIKPQTAARLSGADLERFRRQIETIEAQRPTVDGATAVAQR